MPEAFIGVVCISGALLVVPVWCSGCSVGHMHVHTQTMWWCAVWLLCHMCYAGLAYGSASQWDPWLLCVLKHFTVVTYNCDTAVVQCQAGGHYSWLAGPHMCVTCCV